MRELRNYGDEVAREITSRGGVEGSLSQERFFEDLMKLVRITVLQLCAVLAYCCGFSTLSTIFAWLLRKYHFPLTQLGDVYRDDPHDLSLEFWWTGADTPRSVHVPYSRVSIPVHFYSKFYYIIIYSLSFILPCFHQLIQHFACLLISIIPFIHVSILSCLHSPGPTSVESVSTSSWVSVLIFSRLPCSPPSYTFWGWAALLID